MTVGKIKFGPPRSIPFELRKRSPEGVAAHMSFKLAEVMGESRQLKKEVEELELQVRHYREHCRRKHGCDATEE